MDYLLKIICHYAGSLFDRTNTWVVGMDFTAWIWVLVVAVVFGFLLLRGHSDKIGS